MKHETNPGNESTIWNVQGLIPFDAAPDAAGNLVSVEILDASQCIADLRSVPLERAG
jgi:hypothetical protein